MQTSIDEVVQNLRVAKNSEKACSLLIGAGCSVSAGIPLANGFVKMIEKDWPATFRKTEPKSYPALMAALPDGHRRDLVGKQIDDAKINWAHIAIAQLMKNGYIDRVLTTNFDPLVVCACAMVGEFPAVYDFAASQKFRQAYVPKKAVFHLHGQRDGFVLLHTEKDVSEHSETLAPLFHEAGRGRMWLVVGYSGENDPVFRHLAEVDRFDYGLIWVQYEDSEPKRHIREGLLTEGKGANYLPDYDADRFFVELAQQLGCFPPSFVCAPFDHLRDVLGRVTPFELPNKAGQLNIVEQARSRIDYAETVTNEAIAPIRERVISALMSGQYQDAIADINEGALAHDEMLREYVAAAHVLLGIKIIDAAESKRGDEADRLFERAGQKFNDALRVKPDEYNALFNMACLLALRGKEEECRRRLSEYLSPPTPEKLGQIRNDADFDSVRHLPWFLELTAGEDALA